ncbi:hypothetical protein SCB49_10567 [unidentified eubacterium SCB49]|nr:hypothetical protein SCB49_10567 [unidentified eubacterium SCB49]
MNGINFKKWAFHFIIWVIIINIVLFYLTISYTSAFNLPNRNEDFILYLSLLALTLFILSLFFIVLSAIQKEIRNYQFWFTIIAIFILGITSIITRFF